MSNNDYLKYLQNQAYRFKAFDYLKSEVIKVYEVNDNKKLQMSAVYDFLEEKYKIELQDVINKNFMNCLKELREVAAKETKDIKSPVIRYLHVEEYTKKHVKRLGG